MKTVSETLRDEIQRSGMTQNAIAIKAGVDPAALFRFIENERDIQLGRTADKLCKALGLELVNKKHGRA